MIALVDCNNFYASCERLFQPQLKNKPIVVLSNNDGCVIARSDEAKLLGIKMGDPAFMIKGLLQQHRVSVFSSNYTLYGDISNRVMFTLDGFTDQIEMYSIDEAFLKLDSFGHFNLTDYAIQIRDTVKQHVGIPVSVGIAPSKTLAKMANRLAKKKYKAQGIHCLDTPERIQEALKSTAVEEIWGVGTQYAKLLAKNKLHTAWDLSQAPEEWIKKNLSVVGQRLYNELKGIRCIEFEEQPPKKKMICVARSFGKLLTEKQEVLEALANYTAMVAEKLRTEQLAASMIHIFLQTNAHRPNDKQYFRSLTISLPVATSHTHELLRHAREGFEIIYRPGYNYSKTGCIAMELVPYNQVQYGIFDKANRPRDSRLMQTIDKVNRSFGKNTVRFALQGFGAKMETAANEIIALLYHPYQRGANDKDLMMYNPFVLLSTKLLDAMIEKGKTHFVRQTYKRGKDELHGHLRAAFLITHYADATRAQIHYDVLANDPNRFLYDITNPVHREKLYIAAGQPLGFKVFSPLLYRPWTPPTIIAQKTRTYINENMNWRPGRNDIVQAILFTQFGELFINLKYRNHEIKVPLEEIENY